MQFRKVLALRGPNLWADFPVLEAWVDLGDYREASSDEVPGLNARLEVWLPTMIEHRCSEGRRGGFFERLRRGTYPAHILEHVALELQGLAGCEVGYGRARATSEDGVYRVVIQYEEESLARACLETARELYLAAYHGLDFNVQAAVDRLRALAQQVRLGPSTRGIVEAARARGIPVLRLNDGNLVQLGLGVRARRIWASETDATGAVAGSIARDKELTRRLLRAIGVPVPEGRPVTDFEDAWAAAQAIGGPVVVKPLDGNQGRGVATRLTSREQIRAAYEAARDESGSGGVIVERHAAGSDFRVLVVGDRVVAAARREPARVIGDGARTVAQLVARVNADPRRGEGHGTALSRIVLDDPVALAVLADQGYTPDSIPFAGQIVLVRRNGNLSTGGTAEDVTDLVHPEVADCCVRAARMIGLDIAGVDLVTLDIARPLEKQGGVVVEVNAAPGLRMHLAPSLGSGRPVGRAIVDLMFPPSDDGRIPIAAVTGVNGKTTTTRFLAHLVAESGKKVGMSCTDGIYFDGRRIDHGDCSGPASARAILMNPGVEVAVLETARGGILRAGLGFDRCDVAVVTNIDDGDHLGLDEVETPKDLARVKRILVENVARSGAAVLNAADPLVVAMAGHCPGSVIFFAQNPDHPVIVAHRAAGGRAVVVRHGEIVLIEGTREIGLTRLVDVPLTHGGRIGFQVENTLAATGAAWALGLNVDSLCLGLETFASEMDVVPGRFNLLEIEGATVVVDYGHNPASLRALMEALEILPHRRRLAVYSTAGDRRDEDMIRQGRILGGAFDRVYLYEDQYTRGRPPGEIMTLFRRGLADGPRVREVRDYHGFFRAAEDALRSVEPGDLLVVQADAIDDTIDFIRGYLATGITGREIDLAEAIEAPLGEAILVGESSELAWPGA